MKKLTTIASMLVILLTSCNDSNIKNIEEYSVVEYKSMDLRREKKYLYVTSDFNFYSKKEYKVGDTIRIVK